MKVFLPLHIAPYRRQTFPLLKPYFDKNGEIKSMADKENSLPFTIVDEVAQSDIVILPMSWNYYIEHQLISDTTKVINDAEVHQKQVLSFITGDYGVAVPAFKNLVVLRANGHRSRLPDYHLGLPSFIADPLKKYFDQDEISVLPKTESPKVGFCGMANTSKAYAMEELSRIFGRNLMHTCNRSKNLPQPLIPTTYRRAEILEGLKSDGAVDDAFIYRRHYQGGAQTPEEKQKTTMEFYKNIMENQYVLCFRGAGNFSVRLYETLAMGRIPVFVNTDCLMPLEDSIDWKKHVVWVEYSDRKNLNEHLISFHRNMSAKEFEELQKSNRKLWLEKLTLNGFFNAFLND